MVWYYYIAQIVTGVITLLVLKFSYFYIKRRYTRSVAYQESDVNGSNEQLLSSEILNLDDQEIKMVDKNNVTRCSGYGSTEDEMQESEKYTTTQDVLDTCKFNSDSHSSIMSWESCHEEISHSELDFANGPFSENHPEKCQPLNLCMRDKQNETETNKITKTFFTDRKHKSIKGIQNKTPKKYLVTKMMEDYDQYELKNKNNLEITKISSIHHDELKGEYNLDNTDHELRDAHNLETTELSSTYHDELKDEYNLDMTEQEHKDDNNLEISELFSTYHDELKDECNLDMTEQELKDDNNLEISELSSTYHDELKDEYNLDMTEQEHKDDNNLEISELFSTYHDELKGEYNLDMTEQELKDDNNLEISELSSIYHDELKDEYNLDMTEQELKDDNNLEISELSSIYHDELKDEYNLDMTENSSNDDHVVLSNVLETTGHSPIHQDGQNYDNKFLTSPELSSLKNDKSISGIDSPNIKFHHDEDQDINGCCKTCSPECTESLPSPIYNNDDNDSFDDIRYVEDYSDISFYDPALSDDAMNEAFVIVEDI